VVVAALVWFLLLSHSLTAGWVIGIIGCRVLAHLAGYGNAAARRHAMRSALAVGGATACGVLMTWLWPYFDITASPALRLYPEGSEFGDHPFRDMGRMYVLAFPAAMVFLWHRRHGFLIGGFPVTFAALQVFRVLDYSYGNRFAFFQAFFAQAGRRCTRADDHHAPHASRGEGRQAPGGGRHPDGRPLVSRHLLFVVARAQGAVHAR